MASKLAFNSTALNCVNSIKVSTNAEKKNKYMFKYCHIKKQFSIR